MSECCNGNKKENIMSSVCILLKSLFNLFFQILSVFLISFILVKDIYKLKITLILLFLSFVLKNIFIFLAIKISHTNAYNTLFEVRSKIIDKLLLLHLGFFKKHTTGELISIMQQSPEALEFYLAHGKPETIEVVIIPLLSFLFLLLIDWRIGLLMLVGVPLMFLTQVIFQSNMKKGLQMYFEHETKMKSSLIEYIKNIAVIKSFAKDEKISDEILKTCRNYCYFVKKSMVMASLPMALIDIFMEIGVVIVMIVGSILFYNNEITLLNLILSITLALIFTESISKTATLHHYSLVFKEACKEIDKILLEETPKNKTKTLSENGDIEFENVSFKYGDEYVIKDVSFSIKKNQSIALIGASGCGKTTIVNLLMGYWEVGEGSIKIAGQDIKEVNPTSLANIIGSVSQDSILFNMSVFENVALGKKSASFDEVVEACKKARCHEFITSLPNGYKTNVGEIGNKLSGGQRQRISIARTILKNAPILILDEATSAIDAQNEKAILEVIKEISKDKTVITIAHHLKTIKDVDKIILLENGKIIAEGKHDELLKKSTEYKKMVEIENKVNEWEL
ncbi:MAG: ABC transporter ATP-binding protein [Treponema sp.]